MNHFKLKDGDLLFDMLLVNPYLMYVLSDMNVYCYEEKLPMTITRIVDEQIEGISTSTTHEEGRAFDLSVRGWSKKEIAEFIEHFNDKYANMYGAYSFSDGMPRLIPPADHGTAPHIHVQIRRNL